MHTPANQGVSQSPAQVLSAEVGRCGVCGDQEDIRMHCSRCGKTIGAECVLDSELNSKKCSICAPARLPGRKNRR